MPEINKARQQQSEKNDLLMTMDRLIRTIAFKTQTIQMQQQQIDILFQSMETICDLVEAARFEELTDLVTMYKSAKSMNQPGQIH